MLSVRARFARGTLLLLVPALLSSLAAACAKGQGAGLAGPGGASSAASSTSATSSAGTGAVTSASAGTGGGESCKIGGETFASGSANPGNYCQVCDPTLSMKGWSPATDGLGCASEMVCLAGSCTSACFVGGKIQVPGASDPGTPCEVCDPKTSTTSDVPAADGTTCGTGLVCKSGTCVSGCFIDSVEVAFGAPDPDDPCKSCQPTVDVGSYSPAADGTACAPGQVCSAGACAPSCFIGNSVVAPGAVDPTDPCRSCVPATSTVAYTPTADGTACGTGDYCSGGTCVVACLIGGSVHMPNSADPNDACLTCQPATSTTTWTPEADGAPCGGGLICASGSCQGECDIGAQVITSGTVNPADECQICVPGKSTTDWSPNADGTACSPGEVCSAGVCTASCFINGTLVPPGGLNPQNLCTSCQPAISTTAFQPANDGTICGSGKVCSGGACGAGCYIGGKFYMPNASNPANPCQTCQPGTSTTAWSLAANGTGCGQGLTCDNGVCASGCYIGTTFYTAGALDPVNSCLTCQPTVLTTGFSPAPNGTACGGGQICTSGSCKPGCVIGGTFYAPNALSPTDPCQSCQPGVSTSAFSNIADGAACTGGGGNVCIGGACAAGCLIGSSVYAANTPEPGHPCQGCVPAQSTTTWTNLPDGSACGSGQVCSAALCQAGCYISGSFYAPGAVAGGSGDAFCETCAPAQSTTAWSPFHQGTACGNPFSGGATCNGTRCCGLPGVACSGTTGCCSFTCTGTCQ